MAVNIIIPKLGTVGGDATIIEWAVKEGEQVKRGLTVLSIETDKINFEIEAESSGLLHIIAVEGTQCPMGTVVGRIAESAEELSELQKQNLPDSRTPVSKPDQFKAKNAEQPLKPVNPGAGERIKISPVARKIAQENNLDITLITGTGPGGRIIREDVVNVLTSGKIHPATGAPSAASSGEKTVKYALPLTGKRGVIARNMQSSLAQSAQVSAFGEIDATELIKFRKACLSREETLGTRVTYNDIIVFTVARVLRKMDIINSSIVDNEINVWNNINVGIAVAIKNGLIVPVIKNADTLTISEISRQSKVLIEKARTNSLAASDITGGTFTTTNMGSAGAGWRFETSIINPPESAIMGVGGITDRAVVEDGQIVVKPIMTYGFTYDHRVIDGAVAIQFMSQVVELIENPALLNL